MKKLIPSRDVEFDPFARVGELSETAPATEGQTEIWTSLAMSPDANLAYNESLAIRIPGAIDRERLQRALDSLIQSHESLRINFSPMGRTLYVAKDNPVKIIWEDWSQIADGVRIERWNDLRRDATKTSFDLENGALFQIMALRFGANEHRMLLTAHHMICDGWSLAILLQDLAQAYTDDKRLEKAPSFVRYAFDEYNVHESGESRIHADYWHNVHADGGAALELPLQGQRPALRTFSSERIDRSIDMDLVKRFKQLAKSQRSSYVAAQLAAFSILMGRLSQQNDFAIGMPAAGQAQRGEKRLVGHCVHLLPLRMQLKERETFVEMLARVRKNLLDAYDHQNFTFGQLLKRLPLERDPSRIPLVSVMFNVDTKLEPEEATFSGVPAHYESNPRFAENFEIFVNISEDKSSSIIECQYNSALFSPEMIHSFLDSYVKLIEGLVAQPAIAYERVAISSLTSGALHSLNQTAAVYPTTQSMVEYIGEAMKRYADKVAVEADDGNLTYKDLWEKSAELCQELRAEGVKRGDRVGLCLHRGSKMLIAQLAILRAGAAYVPLDPAFPKDRLDYMSVDAHLALILCERSTARELPMELPKLQWEDRKPAKQKLADVAVSPADAAYMIYTSGSTGRPKGVLIGHQSVVNFLQMMQETLEYKPGTRLLAVTTLSFDIAVLELFLPLIAGGTVIIASDSVRKDGFLLAEKLDKNNIDMMQATPSTWRMLLTLDWKPRKDLSILCGGEAFPLDLRDVLCRGSKAVWNLYGPTEATVWITAKRLEVGDDTITVGRPIGNTTLFILDQNLQALPLGVKGEVYIGGDALAHGYWMRPELDAERFLTAPEGLGRIYRTGDVGRLRFDGDLEIMGRVDAQIKLRGYRIELGEIESRLLESPLVRAGTVLLREDTPGDQRLVAYIVWRDGEREADLRKHLGAILPDYMIPSALVTLEALPLLPNGKINRKALPAGPAQAAVEVQDSHWEGDIAEIAALWSKTLGRSQIQAEDDFFLIGGHSLLAIQMLAQLNKLRSSKLTLRDIFQHPRFLAFAKHAVKASGDSVQAISKRAADDKRLSMGQERMWYVEQMTGGGTHVHNLPGAWVLHGDFDYAAWVRALEAMASQHDVLRMTFPTVSGIAEQKGHDEIRIPCPLIDLSGDPNGRATAQAQMDAVASQGISLESYPLAHFAVYRLNPKQHIFFINVHHIIWDGWSFDLFWSQITVLYGKALRKELDELPAAMSPNYGDFSAWQRRMVAEGGAARDHWLKEYSSLPDALDLPLDKPRPPQLDSDGDSLFKPWAKAVAIDFEKQAQTQESTPFMLAMAIFVLTLHRITGQTDIVVGTPVRGRTRPEFENLMGLFINVLPLRFRVDANGDFRSLLSMVRKVCMEGFAHQDFPFESLMNELKIPRDESRTPLFTAMFSFQDVSDRVLNFEGIRMEQGFVGSHGIPTDFVFWMKRSPQKVDVGMDYRTRLWKRSTIEGIYDIFGHLQQQTSRDATQKLSAYELCPPAQGEAILAQARTPFQAYGPETLVQTVLSSMMNSLDSTVRAGSKNESYADVLKKAASIAEALKNKGVKAGDRVGLCMDRSMDLLHGMLGILMAGAAYVPLDPSFPRDRLSVMTEQAGLKYVVTQEDWLDLLPVAIKDCVLVETLAAASMDAVKAFAKQEYRPENPAYAIFTSGSTGQPKAVQISQRAAQHFLKSMQAELNLAKSDVCLALTTVTFDISVLEIFGTLMVGGRLIIADGSFAADGEALGALLAEESISFAQATPSGWRVLLDSGWAGNPKLKAVTGGEPLTRDLLERLMPKIGRLWNAYGPTEATVWATVQEIRAADEVITIGKPLPGYETFVLDAEKRLQGLGVWGELYLGGIALADGYLNDKERTDQRFVPHALASAGRIYATGDIVRLRSDGLLEFKARLDTQVKLRGYRIELEEIETIVGRDPRVSACAAKVWEPRAGDQRLVLYVSSQKQLSLADLQATFRSFLPKYMWPSHLENLAQLPKTANGKLDRKSLPLPNFSNVQQNVERVIRKAESAAEKTIAEIWSELLGVQAISMDDNFFDLGGHSLLSLRMLQRVNEKFTRSIKLRDVLTASLGQLAALVDDEDMKTAKKNGKL